MILERHRALVLRLALRKQWKLHTHMRLPWVEPSRGTERLHRLMLAAQQVDDNHHAPCCQANHYHRARLVFQRCTCGANAALEEPATGWKCDLGDGEWDHDWQYVKDWYGDPEVINGTADCSFLRCRVCGEEDHESDLSNWRDDDDDYL